MNIRLPIVHALSTRAVLSSLLGVMSLLVLSACGGGSSSSATSPPTANSSTINPGIYMGAVNGKDWITVLLPSTNQTTNFFALHYNGTDPDIYSGTGQITGSSTANLSKVSLYPDNSKPVRTGTGTVSSLGNGIVRAALTFPSVGTDVGKDISIDHSAPSGYTFNTAASLALAQGSWQGRWSYGQGFAENFTLTISPQGQLTSSAMFQNDCQLTESQLTVSTDGGTSLNLFNWSLKIPNATICSTSLGGQTLSGAGFMTNSPVAGKTKRLILVATTPDGRGVSFKADR